MWTIGAALTNPTTDVTSGPYAGTYNLGQNIPDANCVANAGILVPTANIYGAVPGLGGFNMAKDVVSIMVTDLISLMMKITKVCMHQ